MDERLLKELLAGEVASGVVYGRRYAEAAAKLMDAVRGDAELSEEEAGEAS